MNWHLLIKIIGGFCSLFGLAMAVPAIYGIVSGYGLNGGIFFPALASIGAGLVLYLSQVHHQTELDLKNCVALVTGCWLIACVLAACPFFFTAALPTFSDALFEAISGLTATASTVIVDIEKVDPTILFWRSLTQWLGGLGYLFSFLTLSPALGLVSSQFFRSEPGAQVERLTPRFWEAARKLWLLYALFSLVLLVLLRYAGMSWFDALNHSLTTVSTGGFSTRDGGISSYNSVLIDYIIAVFMLLSAVNFNLTYRLFVLFDLRIFFSTEFKWFIAIAGLATLLVTFTILGVSCDNLLSAFHDGFFVVASTISTTGFARQDYIHWPPFTHVILILLVVMGGMSGSTAGGLKCIRLVVAFKQMLRHFRQVLHPSAVLTIRADNQSVSLPIMEAIWSLIFMYFFTFAVLCAVLAAEGFDLLSAASASFSTLSNFGPAFGQLGPHANYATLSEGTKLTFAAGMLLGRLEFYSLLVLLTPGYWKG